MAESSQLGRSPKRVLDLFCGAGGAAMGLHQAWPEAEIVGVDCNLRHYPFKLIRADAMKFSLDGYDFIWASPPCQGYTAMNHRWNTQRERHPRLIDAVRRRLQRAGVSWAIENVQNAPLRNPVVLCGQFFGLAVRRHRKIET